MTAWEGPGCPFRIEFATRKLEEIRDAVVRAFYSMPRGGIEIGGVLFGTRDGQRLRIEEYRMLPCEHKLGPGFQLSARDREALAKTIAEGPLEPLGWFVSHTRSEIALSPADLEIQEQYFPKAWQIALVLKPANMRPMRAGYFCRAADGHMPGEKSCGDFTVEVVALEALPQAEPATVPPPPAPTPTVAASQQVATPVLVEHRIPRFAEASAVSGGNAWVWIAALVAVLVLGVAAWVTRASWMPALVMQ